jgi:hypothetical protein
MHSYPGSLDEFTVLQASPEQAENQRKDAARNQILNRVHDGAMKEKHQMN